MKQRIIKNYLSLTFIKFRGCRCTRISFCLLLETCVYISVVLIRTVSENSLYIADINILLQQKRGKRVSKHMRRNMLLDFGKFCISVYHKANRLVRQLIMQSVYKEISARYNVLLNMRISVANNSSMTAISRIQQRS